MQLRPSRTVLLAYGFSGLTFIYGLGVGAWQWPPFKWILNTRHAVNLWRRERMGQLPTTKNSYEVSTSKHSFFELDNNGLLIGPIPKVKESEYYFRRTILSAETAVIVMDPWVDMPSDFLNSENRKALQIGLLPAVQDAVAGGHLVIVLTNNPATSPYSSSIPWELSKLAREGKAEILYHDDLNERRFATYLNRRNITTLIYTGFHSNICVIGRPTGLVCMANKGFKLYFVPEASAAAEFGNSWQDGTLHRATTMSISMSLAEILHLDSWQEGLQTFIRGHP